MTTSTVHLSAAGGPDARLADELARALPRFLRRRRDSVVVQRDGDPAAADWFLLLASPEAAADERVGDDLRRRLAGRGVEQLQVVVAAGTWVWDQQRGRLDLDASTAAHPALADAFPREPRHLVYRGDRAADVRLSDLVFREQVAEIVAPVHGLTKDELFGEEVRQQQRTRRLTRATAAALVVLTAVALGGAAVASAAAAEAGQQRDRAEEQRVVADRERVRAETERDAADSRRLAALATQVVSTDGALARLLAIEAHRIAPTPEATAVLRQAALTTDAWDPTQEVSGVRRLVGHGSRPVTAAVADDGSRVATVDEQSVLRVWPVDRPASPTEVTGVGAGSVAFSGDGRRLAAATRGQLLVFDADGSDRAAIDVLGARVGSFAETGFVVADPGVALVEDDEVVARREAEELDLEGVVTFVAGSADGERVVVGTAQGEVLTLDRDLEEVSRWQLEVAVDQLGERDSRSLLAWDGGDRVVLPPDNRQVLGPVLGPAGPDEQDRAVAGVYDLTTGRATETVAGPSRTFSLPATSATFLADGTAVAVSPGGLEAPPVLATTGDEVEVPLPPRADLVRSARDAGLLLVAGDDSAAAITATGADPTDPAEPAPVEDEVSVEAACATAGRNLSQAEWDTYLTGRPYRASCEGYDAPYEPTARGNAAAPEPEPEDPAPTPGAGGGDDSGDDAGGDPFAGIDLANSTYDLGCFVDEEALVDGKATEAEFGSIVELVEDTREDRNGDGVPDAVLTFTCTGLASLSTITLVLDGADPASLTELEKTLELQ